MFHYDYYNCFLAYFQVRRVFGNSQQKDKNDVSLGELVQIARGCCVFLDFRTKTVLQNRNQTTSDCFDIFPNPHPPWEILGTEMPFTSQIFTCINMLYCADGGLIACRNSQLDLVLP